MLLQGSNSPIFHLSEKGKAGNTSSCPLVLQLTLQLLQLDVWCPVAAVAAVPRVTEFSRIVAGTLGTAATAATGHNTSSFRLLPTYPATPATWCMAGSGSQFQERRGFGCRFMTLSCRSCRVSLQLPKIARTSGQLDVPVLWPNAGGKVNLNPTFPREKCHNITFDCTISKLRYCQRVERFCFVSVNKLKDKIKFLMVWKLRKSKLFKGDFPKENRFLL